MTSAKIKMADDLFRIRNTQTRCPKLCGHLTLTPTCGSSPNPTVATKLENAESPTPMFPKSSGKPPQKSGGCYMSEEETNSMLMSCL